MVRSTHIPVDVTVSQGDIFRGYSKGNVRTTRRNGQQVDVKIHEKVYEDVDAVFVDGASLKICLQTDTDTEVWEIVAIGPWSPVTISTRSRPEPVKVTEED